MGHLLRRHLLLQRLHCRLGSTLMSPVPSSQQQDSFSTATAIPQHNPPGNSFSVHQFHFQESAFSELSKDRIPGKQMSCTWKNFALYLISPACDEPTVSFNPCRLWKQPRHSWAALGHDAWATLGVTGGDTADKGRADTLRGLAGLPGAAHPGQRSFRWSEQLKAL